MFLYVGVGKSKLSSLVCKVKLLLVLTLRPKTAYRVIIPFLPSGIIGSQLSVKEREEWIWYLTFSGKALGTDQHFINLNRNNM